MKIISETKIYAEPKKFILALSDNNGYPSLEEDNPVKMVAKSMEDQCFPSYVATILPEEGEKANGVDIYVCSCSASKAGAFLYRVTSSDGTAECGFYDAERNEKEKNFHPKWKNAFDAFLLVLQSSKMKSTASAFAEEIGGVEIAPGVIMIRRDRITSDNSQQTIH